MQRIKFLNGPASCFSEERQKLIMMPVLFARLTFSKISAAISILFADKRKNYLAKFLKLY